MELSRKNEALLRTLHTRHGRRKASLCLCEGVRAVDELCLRKPELIRFTVATEDGLAALRSRRELPGELFIVSENKLSELSATVSAQGIITVAALPEEIPPSAPCTDPFILALDQLGDPGNFGTIVRSARAAGLTEIWYTKGSIDPYGDKAVRSALGAQFAMRMRCFEDLKLLRDGAAALNYRNFFLTDPHDGENCFAVKELYDHSVLVIGGEANGVSMLPDARHILIPMPGKYESLNAAQAATVFLFNYVRLITT